MTTNAIPARYSGNTPYTVVIYDGSHFADKILHKYNGIGSIDQIKASAEVHLRQRNKNGRHWVDLMCGRQPITHWILQA